MFFAKKLVSRFLFPVPLCLGLLLAGVVLLWFTKRQRTGKTLVSVGTILLGLLSHSVVADRLLAPLELQYPPLLCPLVVARSPDRVTPPTVRSPVSEEISFGVSEMETVRSWGVAGSGDHPVEVPNSYLFVV